MVVGSAEVVWQNSGVCGVGGDTGVLGGEECGVDRDERNIYLTLESIIYSRISLY